MPDRPIRRETIRRKAPSSGTGDSLPRNRCDRTPRAGNYPATGKHPTVGARQRSNGTSACPCAERDNSRTTALRNSPDNRPPTTTTTPPAATPKTTPDTSHAAARHPRTTAVEIGPFTSPAPRSPRPSERRGTSQDHPRIIPKPSRTTRPPETPHPPSHRPDPLRALRPHAVSNRRPSTVHTHKKRGLLRKGDPAGATLGRADQKSMSSRLLISS